jgi:hypothetical protein
MKTAVEWLHYVSKQRELDKFDWEQAKEMEREQIIGTWHNGYNNQSPMIDEENCGQRYYNETYKSE